MSTGEQPPAGRPPWKWSPYDRQLHLIGRQVGEVAEALCEHSVPIDRLEEPGDADQARCIVCIMMLGRMVSEKRGDPGNYGM